MHQHTNITVNNCVPPWKMFLWNACKIVWWETSHNATLRNISVWMLYTVMNTWIIFSSFRNRLEMYLGLILILCTTNCFYFFLCLYPGKRRKKWRSQWLIFFFVFYFILSLVSFSLKTFRSGLCITKMYCRSHYQYVDVHCFCPLGNK